MFELRIKREKNIIIDFVSELTSSKSEINKFSLFLFHVITAKSQTYRGIFYFIIRFLYRQAIEDKALERPRPGGRVWIKKRLCKFADTEYIVKDHEHVHYHMVDSIPQFNDVKRTKAVMQRLLDGRQYGDDVDYFEDTQPKPLAVEDS